MLIPLYFRIEYLGCEITSDDRWHTEIIKRIALAKNTFRKMSPLLTNNSISWKTKSRVLRCYVWSTLLHGSECWTIMKELQNPRGTSLIGKSVRDFFKTKGFLRIFDGFFLKTKEFLPRVYEILGSEMPLGRTQDRDTTFYLRGPCANRVTSEASQNFEGSLGVTPRKFEITLFR